MSESIFGGFISGIRKSELDILLQLSHAVIIPRKIEQSLSVHISPHPCCVE